MDIEVSFERWKQMTARLENEADTFDALIGRLLESATPTGTGDLSEPPSRPITPEPSDGVVFKGVHLPHGTRLRATYKGSTYFAEIRGNAWVDMSSGNVRSSPSQAAYYITGGTVNGWLFWLVKRPSDLDWQSLNDLRANQ